MDLSNFSYSHIYWIFLLPLIGAGADIVTGWIQASINNCWKSDIMRAGLSLSPSFCVRNKCGITYYRLLALFIAL